jgi:hypothetical protein
MLKVSGYHSLPRNAVAAANNNVGSVPKDLELSIIDMSAVVK